MMVAGALEHFGERAALKPGIAVRIEQDGIRDRLGQFQEVHEPFSPLRWRVDQGRDRCVSWM